MHTRSTSLLNLFIVVSQPNGWIQQFLVVLTVALYLLTASTCESAGTITPIITPPKTLTPKAQVSSPTVTHIHTQSVNTPSGLPTVRHPVDHLAIMPLNKVEIDRYGLLEIQIQTDIPTTNPYDPGELDIRVRFKSPTGKVSEVGAFWYQDFDPRSRNPKGETGWRARFTPTETGAWTAVAHISSLDLQSAPIAFQVNASDHPGFIRIHPSNPRYFAFDDGSFFFPIGLNMAWWSGAGDALTDYKKWMDLFSANGGNSIRVWMAEWSFGIEWNDTPLGDYDNRLRQAWLLDQIFAMAEEHDIYVVLVLLNCADFNNWQTDGWNGNPYNAVRGGPLEEPEQFVTDPTACALLQRRLNYIVNRWGYSPRLLAWEWWNEVNLAPFVDETLIPWLQEMTAYLRVRDVNRHLITNSYAIRDLSPIWDLPEMDIIQKHEYALQVDSMNKDLAERVVADFTRLARSAPAKPILLGEFGYGSEGYGNDVDRTGIHLHNGIWATTFTGYAGSGMYWYWDVYVEAYHVWYHFRGLNQFFEDVDLSRYQPFSPLEISSPGGDPDQAAGLGLHGEDILVWFRSRDYTVQAAVAASEEALVAGKAGPFTYEPPLVENLVLILDDVTNGEYTVRWFDPQTSRWLDRSVATAQNGILSIPVPNFRRDLAAKIVLTTVQ